ncbi:hypothetical protein TIFTF001_027088 [Ficus carica]|uniref:Uncharacterized protein n=1 Tax=Ficus carica TaxID=3494 RepID=A0AA88DMB4_FICCA|nr:hypothetical protein TIFTF001_027088 [Ficus carica]
MNCVEAWLTDNNHNWSYDHDGDDICPCIGTSVHSCRILYPCRRLEREKREGIVTERPRQSWS